MMQKFDNCGERSSHSKILAAILAALLLFSARSVGAQDSNIFIYPTKNQSEAQQDKDRYECHNWAVKQTGFDPSRPQTTNPNSTTGQYQPSQPHVLKGAGRGAALGA